MNLNIECNYISYLKRYLNLIANGNSPVREIYDTSRYIIMESSRNSKGVLNNDPRVEMALLTFDFISQCEPSIEDAKNAASKAIDRIEAYEGSGALYKMTA